MSTVGLKRAELDWAAALSQTMPATPAHSSEMEGVFDTKKGGNKQFDFALVFVYIWCILYT